MRNKRGEKTRERRMSWEREEEEETRKRGILWCIAYHFPGSFRCDHFLEEGDFITEKKEVRNEEQRSREREREEIKNEKHEWERKGERRMFKWAWEKWKRMNNWTTSVKPLTTRRGILVWGWDRQPFLSSLQNLEPCNQTLNEMNSVWVMFRDRDVNEGASQLPADDQLHILP